MMADGSRWVMSKEQQQQPESGSTTGKESSRRLLQARLGDVPGQRALPARLVSAIKVCAPTCIITPAQVHVFTAHTALTCILLPFRVFTALNVFYCPSVWSLPSHVFCCPYMCSLPSLMYLPRRSRSLLTLGFDWGFGSCNPTAAARLWVTILSET